MHLSSPHACYTPCPFHLHWLDNSNFILLTIRASITVAAVWGMNSFRPLEHWGRGFEFHSRHGCLCAFVLCLCCSLCR
jgi:hypothetical protein